MQRVVQLVQLWVLLRQLLNSCIVAHLLAFMCGEKEKKEDICKQTSFRACDWLLLLITIITLRSLVTISWLNYDELWRFCDHLMIFRKSGPWIITFTDLHSRPSWSSLDWTLHRYPYNVILQLFLLYILANLPGYFFTLSYMFSHFCIIVNSCGLTTI